MNPSREVSRRERPRSGGERTSELPPDFLDELRSPLAATRPKHARLRQAIAAAIDRGHWKEGEPLPPELDLVRMTSLSLGTVQRAIQALVAEGRLRRVKGRGTFVTKLRLGIEQPFVHARFLDASGEALLPVFATLVSRRRIAETGPWSVPLRQRGDDVLRIERLLDVDGEFAVGSRFYVNATDYPAFAARPDDDLRSGNFKLMLAREYGLARIEYRQTMTLGRFPPDVAALLGLRFGTIGATFDVIARTSAGAPVYYHEVHVPPNARSLVIPDLTLSTGQ